MLRILRRLKHAFELLPIIALLMICAACRNSSSHCYLCQSVPYNEPCIINLATGEIAVLSTGGYGHAELSIIGGVSVTGINGESCRATIPANGAEMNPALFGTFEINGRTYKTGAQMLLERCDEFTLEKAGEICQLDPERNSHDLEQDYRGYGGRSQRGYFRGRLLCHHRCHHRYGDPHQYGPQHGLPDPECN